MAQDSKILFSSNVLSLGFSNSPFSCRFDSGIRWYVLYQNLLGHALKKNIIIFFIIKRPVVQGLPLSFHTCSYFVRWVLWGQAKHCSEWSWILLLQNSIIRWFWINNPIPFSYEQACREPFIFVCSWLSLSKLIFPHRQISITSFLIYSDTHSCDIFLKAHHKFQ